MELPESGVSLTVDYVKTLGTASEGARVAVALLDTVARTLTGIDTRLAVELHADFAAQHGRCVHAVKKAKTAGAVVTVSGETDFSKAGFRPPFLMSLAESGQHIFKLRKLGAFPADVNLAVDFDKIKAKHADRFNRE